MTSLFTCDVCKLTYEKLLSEQEEKEQSILEFGREPIQEDGIVCHPCFVKMNNHFVESEGNFGLSKEKMSV